MSWVDDGMLAQLITDFGARCSYRRAFAETAKPAGWLGPGPIVTTRPVGTHDAAWDATEHAALDSTIDAGTGYTGGYAAAVPVGVLFLPTSLEAMARWAAFGVQLDELHTEALILASAMTPARGDLLIHPNGTRYVVSEEQRRLGFQDSELGYRVVLERRAPGDVVYTI